MAMTREELCKRVEASLEYRTKHMVTDGRLYARILARLLDDKIHTHLDEALTAALNTVE